MTNMEITSSAFRTAAPQYLESAAAPCLLGNGGYNDGNSRTDSCDDSTHHGSRLPPVVLQNSGGETENRSTQPPIALLSRRRHQDPAVMRLHAALALRETGDSAYGSPDPQAPSSWTTNSAVSPKNSFSLGYDDDAVSSFLSTPVSGSSNRFFRRAKSLVFPSVLSSASLASGDEVNHASSVMGTATAFKSCSFMSCRWMSRRRRQQQQPRGIEGQQEGFIEAEKQRRAVGGVRALFWSFDARACTSQSSNSDMSDSDIHVCGIPTDSSADVVAAWELDGKKSQNYDVDDEAALSHPEDDDVVGVTAEGEFIYRRDIAAEGTRLGRRNKHRPGGCLVPDECGEADASPTLMPTAPFCTPERNIFATVLSDRARIPPHPHEERGAAWKNATAMPPTAPLPGRAAVPRRGSTGRSSQRKTREWTPSDAEWCSLLLRYRACENADEMEYKELVSAMNNWHEARRRYPTEALERRLREGDSYDRPPFVLRW